MFHDEKAVESVQADGLFFISERFAFPRGLFHIGPKTLAIFHTNDIHGYAAEGRDGEGKLMRAGYPRLKTMADEAAADYKLLLDAGDMLHGQPLATARRGEAVAMLLGPMGYDALAVGNHEFDYGLERLLELRKKYRLPFVAANVRYKKNGRLVFPPYMVKNFKSLRVGIFGLSSPETPVSTSPANVAELTFSDGEEMAKDAREAVRQLKEVEKVDLALALTHLGTEPFIQYGAEWLAEQVPGIDFIIDGHSHSEVRGLKAGGAVIASTGAFFRNVGGIERDDEGQVSARLFPAAELEKFAPDPEIESLLEKAEKTMAKDLAVVVGRTPFELEGERAAVRNGGTNLGRLITAAMMRYAGANAALFNSGSIRASIPAGEVTRGKLLEVLPYGNYAVTVKLSGAELRKVLAQSLKMAGGGGFLQFAGLKIAARPLKAGYEIRSIEIGGRPLSDRAEYVVAINDFMNAGGDGYDLLKKTPLGEYETVEEMLLKYIAETPADELARVARTENLITGNSKLP